jgi:predicted nucleotidyltransferase
MRLTNEQRETILRVITEVAGPQVRTRLFGSRVDDSKRGGDIDLMIEMDEPITNPAELSATLASRLTRSLDGRHVDVLLLAPNLNRLPIHQVALARGILL